MTDNAGFLASFQKDYVARHIEEANRLRAELKNLERIISYEKRILAFLAKSAAHKKEAPQEKVIN